MRQLVGTAGAENGIRTVRDLLVSISPERIRRAALRLDTAHAHAAADPMRYATALAEWGDAGGYDAEVLWDECAGRALDADFRHVADRPLTTLSGGEQKRLALEALLRGEDDVLVLDEPDNFLDVPAKRWLERELRSSRKTVLFVSHDRELLAASSTKIVTVEAEGTWTHGAGFATYAEARAALHERLEHDRAVYDDERKRLEELVAEMARRAKISDTFAPKLKAAESRLRLFIEKNERPTQARAQKIDVRLRGARTGKRAVIIEGLELLGLTDPFDLELWYGERVAVLGGNGVGKSHFLRLLAGYPTEHEGKWRLGAGVMPGLFHQTHDHPEWIGRTLVEILHDHDVVLGPAMGMLRRYEMQSVRPPAVPDALRWAAGPVPDPAARAVRRDVAPPGRTHRQPRSRLGRGTRSRARPLRWHGHRGHPRSLVPPRLRPLRRVRRRLRGHRPHGVPGGLALSGRADRSVDPHTVGSIVIGARVPASCADRGADRRHHRSGTLRIGHVVGCVAGNDSGGGAGHTAPGRPQSGTPLPALGVRRAHDRRHQPRAHRARGTAG